MPYKLENVDYGISIVETELPLLEYHLMSLNKYYQFDNIFILDKTESGILAIPNTTIIKIDRFFRKGYRGISTQTHWDHPHSWDFLVRNCGINKKIILSHPDLVYRTDSPLKCLPLDDDIGVIGGRSICLVDREAYKNCFYGFWPVLGLIVVKIGKVYQLRYITDYRLEWEKGEKIVISTPDSIEFIHIEMQLLGYRALILPQEAENAIYHVNNGSLHCNTKEAIEETNYRIEEMKRLALE